MQNNIVLSQIIKSKMNKIVCPISMKIINENVIRITAGIMFTLILLFIITLNIWFLIFALFEFSFRIFESINFSPISRTVKIVYKIANLPDKPVDKAPKVFAARLGFFMTALSFGFFFISLLTSQIITGILAVCIFAEAAFNYCIGCVIYNYLVLPFYKKKNKFDLDFYYSNQKSDSEKLNFKS